MNSRIPAILAAFSLSVFGAAHANDAMKTVKPDSHGSKGDFTASDEGKSSSPVPPATVASAEKATGADGRLVDSVTKALNADSSLKGSKIKVMASNGDITLSGSVKDSSQSAKAESDAKSKSRSGKITNNLTAAG